MNKKFYAFQIAFLFVFLAFTNIGASAQGGVYFNEGFELSTGWPGTAAESLPFKEVVTTTTGSWFTFGAYRSSGPTGGCTTATGGLSHVRFANLTSVTGGTAADSSYLVTPVGDAGIYDISFYNGRASRPFVIYKTSSTDAATTEWTFVASLSTTYTACDLFTVLVNDATAKRLKIKAKNATDSDLDSMIMRSVGTLPSRLGATNAQWRQDGGVTVSWQANNEMNVKGYYIQRSTDGAVFNDLAFVQAANKLSANYTYNDVQAGTGMVFYRIKGQDIDGKNNFGTVVKIKLNKTIASGVWAVNPVSGKTIELQLNNLKQGVYNIQVLDAAGKSVAKKSVNVQSERMSVNLPLQGELSKGMYFINTTGLGYTTTKKVVVTE